MAGSAGKRERAVELSTKSTTRGDTIQQNGLIGSTSTIPSVFTTTSESNVVDLYGIGAEKTGIEKEATRPFIHKGRFHGQQGEVIRQKANIDDGAMKEVMSLTTFNKVNHRLGTSKPSSQLLRVANGVVVQSEARWEGKVEVNGVMAEVAFEVFDSGGKWEFLFGKTLLETFKAVHDYESDEIVLCEGDRKTTLRNQSHTVGQGQPHPTVK